MRMVSYAQNAEDVVLARAFAGVTDGYYVDVGAAHPVLDNTTKWFSELGWSGINVEPLSLEAGLLAADRPGDVNLELALSDRPGTMALFVGPPLNRGSSTLDADVAESHRRQGEAFDEGHTVNVSTLQAVLDEHASRPIDFLKIDVEGHEEAVLRGIDLSVWRPRVLLVEATRPGSPVPSHEAWEPLVLSQRYSLTLFDGLNRFYVRDEDREELGPALSVAANVFDDYEPFRFRAALAEADRLARSVEAQLRADVARLQAAAGEARERADGAEQERRQAEQIAAESALDLENLYRTKTFRLTAAPRRLYGRFVRLAFPLPSRPRKR